MVSELLTVSPRRRLAPRLSYGTKRTSSEVRSVVANGRKADIVIASAEFPGCVKTPTLKLRVEFLSQFRRCGNRLHRRLPLGEGN
jgi:hypothetical protein